MQSDVILLPGLHGSTTLYEPFLSMAPPWAKCLPIPLPTEGDQSFDSLAEQLEPRLRHLEGFVLFAESFAGPIAARLAEALGSRVALLVLSNPLVKSPVPFVPPFAVSLLQWKGAPAAVAAFLLTGGNRPLARAAMREIRLLPRAVLAKRLETACSARKDDLASRLAAPLLGIVGGKDRLLPPSIFEDVLARVPHAVEAKVAAPHLAAQFAPAEVWAAISEVFQRVGSDRPAGEVP